MQAKTHGLPVSEFNWANFGISPAAANQYNKSVTSPIHQSTLIMEVAKVIFQVRMIKLICKLIFFSNLDA
jgi:hypothetical protein